MSEFNFYTIKGGERLRLGYTTGSCAAAAALAATTMLLNDTLVHQVTITTPSGISLPLEIENIIRKPNFVSCGVRKFSGDDPDITNGMLIYGRAEKTENGVTITGGEGIGKVTQPGLSVKVGEYAINPVPLTMIRREVDTARKQSGYTGGIKITVYAPEGRLLAKKTYNPRLGIEGGISILGTTGIVEPMSSKALVDTIKLELDHSYAKNPHIVVVVPGNYGRDFAQKEYGVDIAEAVQCSNYIGEALDYISYLGFKQLVLLGHAGKLVKLAAGIMNTHSSMADGRMEIITSHAGLVGGLTSEQVAQLLACITVDGADQLLGQWGISGEVWESISGKIAYHLSHRLGEETAFSFVVFGGRGILTSFGEPKKMINHKGEVV